MSNSFEGGRRFKPNLETFNIHGSAALIVDDSGNLFFHQKGSEAPIGPREIATFGGAREEHKHAGGHDFVSRESTNDAARREVAEELGLEANQIASARPFGYQSFNFKNNPDKGFSVNIVRLAKGVSYGNMTLNEGQNDRVPAKIREVPDLDQFIEENHDTIFPPILEMLERNRDRIKKLVAEVRAEKSQTE